MSILSRLYDDMKVSMKAGTRDRTETVRQAIAILKKEAIDTGKELDEAAEVAVISRAMKQRREAADIYQKAGRPELEAKERAELAVLEGYLPQQVSDADLEAAVQALVEETGASSPKDLGKVMGRLLAQFKGRLDGNRARAAVTRALGGA